MSRPEGAPVPVLRRAAKQAVAARSLRGVARDMGLSPMWLSDFMNGSRRPQAATLRKLNQWFVVYVENRPEYSEAAARAALEIFLDGLPEAQRDAAVAAWLRLKEELHRRGGTLAPDWVEKLKAPPSDEEEPEEEEPESEDGASSETADEEGEAEE
jgi:transcriptional regulator with XRE-family HTH domain